MGSPLLGREVELEVLRRLLAGAAQGQTSCVVIDGDFGAGKTALLDVATSDARAMGFSVRLAKSARLESHLAGGVARQLVNGLSGEQDLEEFLQHVRGVALRGPLLLAVDDVHFADTWSKRCLAYARPRLTGLPVAIVLCTAKGYLAADEVSLPELAGGDHESLELSGLDLEAVGRLVGDDAQRCHDATGGNPYLVHAWLRDGADGSAAVGELLRVRLREHDGAAEVVRAAAVLDRDASLDLLTSLTGFDTLPTVDTLVRLGILADTDPLAFAQPFVRNSVLADMPVAVRSSGHARAARLLHDVCAADERIAGHVLEARSVRLAWAVDLLRRTGGIGPLTRALDELMSDEERLAVQVELGHAEHLVDPHAGRDRIRDALARAEDPRTAAQVALSLILRMCSGSDAHLAVSIAILVIARLMPEDRDMVWRLVCITYLTAAGRDPQMACCAGKYYDDLVGEVPQDASLRQSRAALLAMGHAKRGDSAHEAMEYAADSLSGEWLDVLGEPYTFTYFSSLLADDKKHADRFWQVLGSATVSHDPHLRKGMLATGARGIMFHAAGDLARAYTFLSSLVATAPMECPTVLVCAARLAEVYVDLGQFEDAERLVSVDGELLQHNHIRFARGRLKLASGDTEGALEALLDCGHRLDALGIVNPAFIPWRLPAVRAHLALGTRDEAARLAHEDLDLAKRWGTQRAIGGALLAVGLSTEDEDILKEACDVLADSPARLLHAEALCELGVLLRKKGKTDAAVPHLRRALDMAGQCGAQPLARLAGAEVREDDSVQGLTKQESRIARMAAQGLTNRQIAETLHLTRRTVELHLSGAYRKLGITGRAELVAALWS